jgi:hypothetical protein
MANRRPIHAMTADITVVPVKMGIDGRKDASVIPIRFVLTS